MTAFTLTNNATELLVGAIATLGLIGAAWVPVRRTRKAAEEAKDTLGEKPAEDVTVISLLQSVVASQSGQDRRLAVHDSRLAEHETKLSEHDQLHTEHIQRLEEHAELLRELRGETN